MMSTSKRSRIALGLITRHFDDPVAIELFLENARTYGHKIDRVIVAYSHTKEEAAVNRVKQLCRLELIHVAGPDGLRDDLMQRGLTLPLVDQLLGLPDGGPQGEVPYGAYRNAILFRAILDGLDYLLFFDADVAPRVLTHLDQGQTSWQVVDFVGRHMQSLQKEHVAATTSEYSGYYIIPPMSFSGMSDLLNGLGKGMALEYMEDCQEHHCLNLGSKTPGLPRPTDKPLGGNLGLDLTRPWRLAPFYSTLYPFAGVMVKGRGEDTLVGQAIKASNGEIMDIDLPIFHDTYDGFPEVPDIRQKSILDRFYWACLGWIGRNPFLSWYLDQAGLLKTDLRSETTLQRIGLEIGGEQAAAFLRDPRFKRLNEAFEASSICLPDAIQRYDRLMNAWQMLLQALGQDQPPAEVEESEVNNLQLAS
jgi:hypothetical protein